MFYNKNKFHKKYIDSFVITMLLFLLLGIGLFYYLKLIEKHITQFQINNARVLKLQSLDMHIETFIQNRFHLINYDEMNKNLRSFEVILNELEGIQYEGNFALPFIPMINEIKSKYEEKKYHIEKIKSYNSHIVNSVYYLFDLRKELFDSGIESRKELSEAIEESFFILIKKFANVPMGATHIQEVTKRLQELEKTIPIDTVKYFSLVFNNVIEEMVLMDKSVKSIEEIALMKTLHKIEKLLHTGYDKNILSQKLIATFVFLLSFIFVIVLLMTYYRIKKDKAELLSYRYAIENGDNIIMMTDTDYNITFVNEAFERNTGYSRGEVIGKNPKFLQSGLVPGHIYKALYETLKNGQKWEGEFINRHKNGKLLYEKTSISPIMDDNVVIGFLALKLDISELIRQQNILKQSSTVFENTREGILILNEKGSIISANNAFLKMTQYTESEFKDKTLDFFATSTDNYAFYKAVWAQISQKNDWSGKVHITQKNGDELPIWLSLTTVYDRDGKIINYIAIYSDLSEVIRTQEKADFLAYHDSLTLLPNRAHFEIYIKEFFKENPSTKAAIMFIDLDRFKVINDTLGHSVGDELLKKVATRINKALEGKAYFFARLGGDEFVVVFEHIESKEEMAQYAKDILSMIGKTMHVDKHQLSISASIGISCYPEDSKDAMTLIKYADSAMYSAKDKGKNTYAYFNTQMSFEAHTRLNIEQSLKKARSNNEIYVAYQPQYDLLSRKVTGVEVLARWNNKMLGDVLPDEFISIAEDTGLIIEIGYYVFEEGCNAFMRWKKRNAGLEKISFNISSVQLRQNDFITKIEQIMKKTGIQGNQIEIELTERVLFEFTNNNVEILNRFRKMGFEISIDDFGTGYSSMSYLKELPIDTVKIDKAFIHGLDKDQHDQKVAKGIIALSKSLGYKVVAEGIETEDQERFLYENGCDIGQGYYFSKPLDEDAFFEFLKKRVRR